MYLDLISDDYKLRIEHRHTLIALLKVTAPTPEPTELPKPVDPTSLSLSPTVLPTSTLPEPVHEIDSDESSSDDDSEDDSEHEYVTASESESDESDNEVEQSEEARRQERQAREAERQRVLEAAGLIIKEDHRRPPPRPVRVRSHRRRPAPAVPERSKTTPSPSPTKDLPPLPSGDSRNPSFRLDDAYERYEAYRQSNLAMNRLSIVSVESSTSTTSQSAPSVTPTTSESGEHRSHTSSFLNLFRSRTPGNDSGEAPARPVISGPILQGEQSPSLESDAAFGSVSGPSCQIPTSVGVRLLIMHRSDSLGLVWSTSPRWKGYLQGNAAARRYVCYQGIPLLSDLLTRCENS